RPPTASPTASIPRRPPRDRGRRSPERPGLHRRPSPGGRRPPVRTPPRGDGPGPAGRGSPSGAAYRPGGAPDGPPPRGTPQTAGSPGRRNRRPASTTPGGRPQPRSSRGIGRGPGGLAPSLPGDRPGRPSRSGDPPPGVVSSSIPTVAPTGSPGHAH